jgi:sugar diacid utilization regulator
MFFSEELQSATDYAHTVPGLEHSDTDLNIKLIFFFNQNCRHQMLPKAFLHRNALRYALNAAR